MTQLAKTPKGRATHAIREPVKDDTLMAGWYASHGWHYKAVCGELVGKAIGQGDPTCKDCLAAIEREADRHRPIRTKIGELAELMLGMEDGEDLPDDLRWRLHLLAASSHDVTLWVRRRGKQWQATEVESGVTAAPATTAKGAADNYWKGLR